MNVNDVSGIIEFKEVAVQELIAGNNRSSTSIPIFMSRDTSKI